MLPGSLELEHRARRHYTGQPDSFTCHAQGRSAREFSDGNLATPVKASENSGLTALPASVGTSLSAQLDPSTTALSAQVMSSAQYRSSLQAKISVLDMSTGATTFSSSERRQCQSELSAIVGGGDRADEDFDDLV